MFCFVFLLFCFADAIRFFFFFFSECSLLPCAGAILDVSSRNNHKCFDLLSTKAVAAVLLMDTMAICTTAVVFPAEEGEGEVTFA